MAALYSNLHKHLAPSLAYGKVCAVSLCNYLEDGVKIPCYDHWHTFLWQIATGQSFHPTAQLFRRGPSIPGVPESERLSLLECPSSSNAHYSFRVLT